MLGLGTSMVAAVVSAALAFSCQCSAHAVLLQAGSGASALVIEGGRVWLLGRACAVTELPSAAPCWPLLRLTDARWGLLLLPLRCLEGTHAPLTYLDSGIF